MDELENLHIQNEVKDFKVNLIQIKKIILFLFKEMGLPAHSQLSLRILSPSQIKELNENFRSYKKATDVLSFPQNNWKKPLIIEENEEGSYKDFLRKDSLLPLFCLGDLVICAKKAQENALSIGHSLDEEFCFLLVHGFLHLCGHDHQEALDEKIMLKEQEQIMSSFRSQSPALWDGCIKEILYKG